MITISIPINGFDRKTIEIAVRKFKDWQEESKEQPGTHLRTGYQGG
jgi:hypothetical protein